MNAKDICHHFMYQRRCSTKPGKRHKSQQSGFSRLIKYDENVSQISRLIFNIGGHSSNPGGTIAKQIKFKNQFPAAVISK